MNKPKIKIPLNEHGQPIGPDATEFANFIGTLVRKHIPPKTIDWRDMDEEKKLLVWDQLQVLHNLSLPTYFLLNSILYVACMLVVNYRSSSYPSDFCSISTSE
jgi:hypothetical protein